VLLQPLLGGVMLEDEIKFKGDLPNPLEDIGLLQIMRIGAISIKDIMIINLE
jgi:hypothetical protein